MLRRVLLALGVALTALGVAVAADPALAVTLGLPAVPRVVVAVLAVAFALAARAARKNVDFRDPEEATVRASSLEGRFEPPRPGADVDADLAAGSGASTTDDRLRERLRVLAVRVLADAEGWSEEEAHRRLDDGTWTDDRAAAALFAADVSPPSRHVVASLTRFESTREREVRHALAELERRAGVGGD
ncbi:hypothetical protein [Halobacterium sp. CBA1126]|uniref:DUF7269 family protein n=1 Tax=Halobacterium TaxID=2239 RepID=UPI0012F90372|nr:hypothetical protein [Halobacterium sp. CBA1126]MUV61918.1 hypothetical protein [Halobacterium sp. CBA1126]